VFQFQVGNDAKRRCARAEAQGRAAALPES